MEALTGNKISIDEARRFLITYQGLNHNGNSQDENSVLEFVRKVGCIQFDPLNIWEKSRFSIAVKDKKL